MADRRSFLAQGLTAAAAACGGPSLMARLAAGDVNARTPTVIDTHTHFYDPTRPQGVPWPGKDDPVLGRPILPPEWEALVEPLGVTGTIVVEASSWVEDNQWLLDLAAQQKPRAGMQGIVGIVGNLPMGDPSCGGLIDRFAKNPLYRGIRVNADKLLAGLDDKTYRSDLQRLAERDLAVDVNGGPVNGAIDTLARKLPGLRILVEHMGSARFPEAGPQPEWRDAIAQVAQHPNVFLKVSALLESQAHATGKPTARTDPAFYEPWLECVWEAFGPRRLMFGSNWPVSARTGSYADILGVVRPFIDRKGPEAQRWFFAEASRDAYRWKDQPS